MRTDAIMDRIQVRCRNSSHIGYSKVMARVGDYLEWEEDGKTVICRMLARIHYAPGLDGSPTITNWICAVRLGTSMSHMCERWVDPKNVTAVWAQKDVQKRMQETLACFLGNDLRRSAKRDIDEVRRGIEWGSTLKRYREWKEAR